MFFLWEFVLVFPAEETEAGMQVNPGMLFIYSQLSHTYVVQQNSALWSETIKQSSFLYPLDDMDRHTCQPLPGHVMHKMTWHGQH